MQTPKDPPRLPSDDLARKLTVAHADDEKLPHLAIAGDTYTLLVTGEDSGGKYCVIDMHIPPGGGPPSHRHDFEEMFAVLSGEIEVTFRGESNVFCSGQTINVPANAPHSFRNKSSQPARLLCVCVPAGQDEFFSKVGRRVESRTAPGPPLSDREKEESVKLVKALATEYRSELL